MDIVYVCNSQIPSRSTNSMQVMRMCAAFSEIGHDVTLVHSPSAGSPPEGWEGSLWDFYGVPPSFEVVELPTGLRLEQTKQRWLARAARTRALWRFQLQRSSPRQRPYVWYGRSLLGASLAITSRALWRRRNSCRAVILEVHDAPTSPAAWRLLRYVDGIVAISDALRRRLVETDARLDGRVWVEHDGADPGLFDSNLSPGDAAAGLGLARGSGPLIVYTGRVNRDKGADVLLAAMDDLHDQDARAVLVGKVYERALVNHPRTNVQFTGFVPPAAIPRYVAAADILVLPTRPTLAYSDFMSPLKLFEYMAARRPIVASDLPVLREVLEHERNALLFDPGDPRALAAQIRRLWDDAGLRERLAENAWNDVRSYSWNERARRITERIVATTGKAVE